jgi:hypothetical protein
MSMGNFLLRQRRILFNVCLSTKQKLDVNVGTKL